MTFMWPDLLWLLTGVPALIAAYLFLLRRRKRSALRFADLGLIKEALGAGQRFRRHIPPLLFLLALTVLILAVARPSAVVTLPTQNETVILALDISGSMRATDVEPNRIAAAQAAAKSFVAEQPRRTRIGVVTFAGTAAVAQAPSNNREEILAAIDRIQLQRATAIGSGILVSLKAIFPEADFDLRSSTPRYDPTRDSLRAAPLDQARAADAPAFKPVPPGSYGSAVVILLSDGQSNVGPNPIESARMAAERGVRVYTVGFGTQEGETLRFEGWSMRVRLDEETLKQIAELTQGEYYYAGTAADLKKVYQTLSARLVFETRETEITALFSAAAAVLALLGGGLSVWWYSRIL
ncbi:MAG: VWA domain-containing protein [Desulfobacterales bacterium]|jgi:Ca-activated chloride channel family protein|nr:VWA domain-containing protein [Desulfobacterales bacterium]